MATISFFIGADPNNGPPPPDVGWGCQAPAYMVHQSAQDQGHLSHPQHAQPWCHQQVPYCRVLDTHHGPGQDPGCTQEGNGESYSNCVWGGGGIMYHLSINSLILGTLTLSAFIYIYFFFFWTKMCCLTFFYIIYYIFSIIFWNIYLLFFLSHCGTICRRKLGAPCNPLWTAWPPTSSLPLSTVPTNSPRPSRTSSTRMVLLATAKWIRVSLSRKYFL